MRTNSLSFKKAEIGTFIYSKFAIFYSNVKYNMLNIPDSWIVFVVKYQYSSYNPW